MEIHVTIYGFEHYLAIFPLANQSLTRLVETLHGIPKVLSQLIFEYCQSKIAIQVMCNQSIGETICVPFPATQSVEQTKKCQVICNNEGGTRLWVKIVQFDDMIQIAPNKPFIRVRVEIDSL